MLFDKDSQYGHVVVKSPEGPRYESDGTLVDPAHPRPCLGCSAHIESGTHDPCIANLPGAYQACCGHGLDKSPVSGLPNGYVAFKDGRCIRFSGLCGGQRIRQAVEAVLAGQPLPDGFQADNERMWWEGLTDAQRAYVHANITGGLARLVRQAKDGGEPSAAFLSGEAMWWDGLTDEQKGYVMNNMRAMLAELVQEALASVKD